MNEKYGTPKTTTITIVIMSNSRRAPSTLYPPCVCYVCTNVSLCNEGPLVDARVYRVMSTAKPSSQGPQDPDTPQMVYPRGGIKLCLHSRLAKFPTT